MLVRFRVILIGDPGVGKSSIVHYFKERNLNPVVQSTIQPDLFVVEVELKNKVKVELQIFDTAGQETYGSMTRSFYRDKDGAVIVYNVTDKNSFDNVQRWLEEAKVYMPKITTNYIVGNMIDKNEPRISTLEGTYKAEYLELKYFETSARDGRNIDKMFIALAEDMYVQKKERPEYHDSIIHVEDESHGNGDKSKSKICPC